jgi:hypothetical protein
MYRLSKHFIITSDIVPLGQEAGGKKPEPAVQKDNHGHTAWMIVD